MAKTKSRRDFRFQRFSRLFRWFFYRKDRQQLFGRRKSGRSVGHYQVCGAAAHYRICDLFLRAGHRKHKGSESR